LCGILIIEVRQTDVFSEWLDKLRDERARAKIIVRVRRLSLGNFGDVKQVGEGVGELRVDYGPGYRVYFARHGAQLIVLLCGGDKSSQVSDIKSAKAMAKKLKEGSDGS
jgi:putative addiction module killer protein